MEVKEHKQEAFLLDQRMQRMDATAKEQKVSASPRGSFAAVLQYVAQGMLTQAISRGCGSSDRCLPIQSAQSLCMSSHDDMHM